MSAMVEGPQGWDEVGPLEAVSVPLSSGMTYISNEEAIEKGLVIDPNSEEGRRLRARLDEIGRCDQGPRGRGWFAYHLEGHSS